MIKFKSISLRSGFSLIEIAIALIVISAIAAAAFKGNELIKQSKLNALVAEADSIKKAIDDFQKVYNAIPGDMWDAHDRIGSNDCSIKNGDGDGTIEDSASVIIPSGCAGAGGNETVNENLLLWQHLALAGLISGEFDGVTNQPNVGLKTASYDKNIVFEVNVTNAGNVLVTASRFTTGASGSAFLSAEEAWMLDKKFDDGIANQGMITAENGASATGSCCTGADCASSGEYDKANDDIACVIRMRVENSSLSLADSNAGKGITDRCSNGDGTFSDIGNTRSCACEHSSLGVTGNCTETCQTGGVWEVTSSTCAFPNCSSLSSNPVLVDGVSVTFGSSAAIDQSISGTCPSGYEGVDAYGGYDNSNSSIRTTGSECRGTAYPQLTCKTPGGVDKNSDGISDGWGLISASGNLIAGTENPILGKCVAARCCAHTYSIPSLAGYTVSFPITLSGTNSTQACPTNTTGTGITGTCLNGTWSYSGTCTATGNSCGNVSLVCGSSSSGDALCSFTGNLTEGQTSTASCPSGWQGGTVTRRCTNNTSVIISGSCYQDCAATSLDCGSGQTCTFPSSANGANVTATCPSGYTGSPSRTCNNSSWGALGGTSCTAVASCSENSPPVANSSANISWNSTDNVWVATITCDSGFTYNPPAGSTTCVPSGTWQNYGTCQHNPCSPATPVISNGIAATAVWDSSDNRWESTISCAGGTVRAGATGDATCASGSSSWLNIGSCEQPCSTPTPTVANATASAAVWNVSMWESEITCDSGYQRADTEGNATCTPSGNWITNANCQQSCPTLNVTNGSATSPEWDIGNSRWKVEINCNSGFSRTGATGDAYCTPAGTWQNVGSCNP